MNEEVGWWIGGRHYSRMRGGRLAQSDPGTVGRGHFPFADLEKSGSRCSNNFLGLREVCLSSSQLALKRQNTRPLLRDYSRIAECLSQPDPRQLRWALPCIAPCLLSLSHCFWPSPPSLACSGYLPLLHLLWKKGCSHSSPERSYLTRGERPCSSGDPVPSWTHRREASLPLCSPTPSQHYTWHFKGTWVRRSSHSLSPKIKSVFQLINPPT